MSLTHDTNSRHWARRTIVVRWLIVGVVIAVGVVAATALDEQAPAIGSGCTLTENISESDAEDIALDRAEFAGFEKNGGDPSIEHSELSPASDIEDTYNTQFVGGVAASDCVWWIIMSGSVAMNEVVGREAPTPSGNSEYFMTMEVGLNGEDGEVLVEIFSPHVNGSTPTYVPTVTGTPPTPYPTPTAGDAPNTPTASPTP